jgi:hypothetical protein
MPPTDRTALVANVALFQAGWFACVMAGAHGQVWIALSGLAAVLGWHLLRARQPRRELVLTAIVALVGAIYETLLAQTGWMRPTTGEWIPGMAAYWLVCLWAVFATTLNVSLRWLRARPLVAAAFGAIGGPLAYYAGSRLGALELAVPELALTSIAIGWAVLTPALLMLARRLDGYST